MKTDMTKGVGFDQFYDSGGGKRFSPTWKCNTFTIGIAVEPEEAARSTVNFISKITHEMTGTFWAPRGPRFVIFVCSIFC